MKRKLLSLALTLALVLGLASPAWAAGTTDENGFTIEDGVLTAYSGEGGEITIPETVTSIAARVFHGNATVTGVTIPACVESIDDGAFYTCSALERVTFAPEIKLTSIGEFAFNSCKFVSIEIPASVTAIGASAFGSNPQLTAITFAESSKIAELNDNCFYYTGITSITIPASVTTIGGGVFGSCISLETINVDEGNQNFKCVDGVLYNADGSTLLAYPSQKGETDGTYTVPEGVTNLPDSVLTPQKKLNIILPASLETVTARSFGVGVKSISISDSNPHFEVINGVLYTKEAQTDRTLVYYPNGLSKSEPTYTILDGTKIIGRFAFTSCAMEQVNFPDSVVTIEEHAFSNNAKLKSITIPSSVTSIGTNGFARTGLTSITILNGNVNIGSVAFANCPSELVVHAPKGGSVETYCTTNNIKFEEYSDYDGTDAMVSVTQADGTYGTELADAGTSAQHTSTNGVWTIKYTGREGTTYPESETKPTLPGAYTVTASYADDKYTGSAAADFQIAKKPVTVTAENKAATYGGTLPELTFTTPALVAGDTAADLGVTLSVEGGAKPSAGTHTITGTASSAKYDVTVTLAP